MGFAPNPSGIPAWELRVVVKPAEFEAAILNEPTASVVWQSSRIQSGDRPLLLARGVQIGQLIRTEAEPHRADAVPRPGQRWSCASDRVRRHRAGLKPGQRNLSRVALASVATSSRAASTPSPKSLRYFSAALPRGSLPDPFGFDTSRSGSPRRDRSMGLPRRRSPRTNSVTAPRTSHAPAGCSEVAAPNSLPIPSNCCVHGLFESCGFVVRRADVRTLPDLDELVEGFERRLQRRVGVIL